jgi:hypothetical protein
MRMVIWEDRNGYVRASLIRDGDPDEVAEHGIPVDPPNLDLIDFEEVKRNLHNALVRQGLFTYKDVQRQQRGITAAIISVLKKPVVDLYKQNGGK